MTKQREEGGGGVNYMDKNKVEEIVQRYIRNMNNEMQRFANDILEEATKDD